MIPAWAWVEDRDRNLNCSCFLLKTSFILLVPSAVLPIGQFLYYFNIFFLYNKLIVFIWLSLFYYLISTVAAILDFGGPEGVLLGAVSVGIWDVLLTYLSVILGSSQFFPLTSLNWLGYSVSFTVAHFEVVGVALRCDISCCNTFLS